MSTITVKNNKVKVTNKRYEAVIHKTTPVYFPVKTFTNSIHAQAVLEIARQFLDSCILTNKYEYLALVQSTHWTSCGFYVEFKKRNYKNQADDVIFVWKKHDNLDFTESQKLKSALNLLEEAKYSIPMHSELRNRIINFQKMMYNG